VAAAVVSGQTDLDDATAAGLQLDDCVAEAVHREICEVRSVIVL
jgi:hypothetical protein